MPSSYVLDTFALLAHLQGENSGTRVREILQAAESGRAAVHVSLINVGQALYITERRRGVEKAQETLAAIRQLPLEILPADAGAVFSAAHIKAGYAISYADAFCVAAALSRNAAILTGDPEFKAVEQLVAVEWIEDR